MKRFKFTLEPLRRLRKIEENRAMAGLAQVMRKVNEQEAIKEASARLAREEMDNFERTHRQSFDLELYNLYYRYLERLDQEARQANLKLEEMQPELQTEKEKVMEARRRLKIVELLRERKKTEYDRALLKWERKQLEEANARAPLSGPTRNEEQESHYETRVPRRRGNEESLETDGDALTMDESEELVPEPGLDAVGEYYKSLGMEDPRKGFKQRR